MQRPYGLRLPLHFWLLATVWIALNSFLLSRYGIVTTLEASKYIQQADYFLANGQFETGNFTFYSTQIFLIVLCKKLGTGYWPIIALQLLCNAASTYCFYRLANRFMQRERYAAVLTGLFLGMFYFQLYNVYLYTESLFFSLSLIFTHLLFRTTRLTPGVVLRIFLGLMVLYFTRPVGILYIPATIAFICLRFYTPRLLLLVSLSGILGLVAFALLLNRSLGSGGELDFLAPYLNEQVICGVPTLQPPHQISLPVQKNSIQAFAYMMTHHGQLFFSMAARRLQTFFGVVRPYYSGFHNLFLALYFYGMYVAIFMGARRWFGQRLPEVSFFLSVIILTALTTALSCDEWHNRFILAIFPFLLLLSSFSVLPRAERQLRDR